MRRRARLNSANVSLFISRNITRPKFKRVMLVAAVLAIRVSVMRACCERVDACKMM